MKRGHQNKRRIVDAAQALFYRQGYNTTSFSDIAQASEVPRGNFYYYFKTKEEILSEVIQERAAELRTMLAEKMADLRDPRERLRRFATLVLEDREQIVRYGCPAGALIYELTRMDSKLGDEARLLFDVLLDWAAAQFETLGHNGDARKFAMLLLGRLQGAGMVCNAYGDSDCIDHEVEALHEWITQL